MVVGLLVAVLVTMCAVAAHHAYQRRQQAERVLAVTEASRDLFAAMNTFRLERGATNNRLVQTPPQTQTDIAFRRWLRVRDEGQLGAGLAKLAVLDPKGDTFGRAAILDRLQAVRALRVTTDADLARPFAQRSPALPPQWMVAATALTDALADTGDRLVAAVGQEDPVVVRMMTTGQLAWAARDAAGTDMLLLGQQAAIGKPLDARQIDQHSNLTGRVDAHWSMLQTSARAQHAPAALTAAITAADSAYFVRERAMRAAILEALIAGRPSPYTLDQERVIDTEGLSSLMSVAATAFNLAAERAQRQAEAAQQEFYATLGVMLVSIGAGLVAILFVGGQVLRPIGRITEAMRAVAEGDLAHPIPDAERPDEVGDLARALRVFRENAVAKQRADAELLSSRIAQEAAEASAQAKAEFLANMSHEIRTPLTSVVGFAGLLAKTPDLPERAQAYAQRIVTGGHALRALVNDILDFSRIEAGQVELEPAPLSPLALLTDTVELIRPEAEAKGLSLTLQASDPLPAQVLADAERVRQVLLNLIGNAIKFTHDGAVTVEAAYRAGDGRLFIRVRDTGVGVSAEHRGRLFQRFSQIDASNTRRYGGAGLGLAISKGLVELMGGEIGVESLRGGGSVFWFSIEAPAIEAPPAPSGDVPEVAVGPLRILVVDDVAVNRELVSALLSPFDATLSEAANGAEAVEAASRSGFDLILMDLQMPVMDGLAATRAIRASSSLNADTPILAVSANVMAPQVEACRAAGMNDHVAKPIDPTDLLNKIGQWVSAAAPAA
ncbi:ATP-binding protein [Phenylobacterium montanum]|uniref:histidine kinase n=1 Tax=Phenylobacterium montanum TaxID=2823693 RepID=A0A975FV61_9CAUL|nr:ATP-binding protein [Caulobacter sp. S6]QUD85985.1 response regulator [Caulobacter sp. S6]